MRVFLCFWLVSHVCERVSDTTEADSSTMPSHHSSSIEDRLFFSLPLLQHTKPSRNRKCSVNSDFWECRGRTSSFCFSNAHMWIFTMLFVLWAAGRTNNTPDDIAVRAEKSGRMKSVLDALQTGPAASSSGACHCSNSNYTCHLKATAVLCFQLYLHTDLLKQHKGSAVCLDRAAAADH